MNTILPIIIIQGHMWSYVKLQVFLFDQNPLCDAWNHLFWVTKVTKAVAKTSWLRKEHLETTGVSQASIPRLLCNQHEHIWMWRAADMDPVSP